MEEIWGIMETLRPLYQWRTVLEPPEIAKHISQTVVTESKP